MAKLVPEDRPRFALVLTTGYTVRPGGNVDVSKSVIGHPEAVKAVIDLEKRTHGAHRVKVHGEDSGNGRSWSGFGNGQLEASKGRRTRRMHIPGRGWVDVSDN